MKTTTSALTALLASLYFSSAAQAQTPTPAASPPAAPPSVDVADAANATAPGAAVTAAPGTQAPASTQAPATSPAAPAAQVSASPRAGDAGDEPIHALPRARDGFYLRMTSGPGFLSLSGDGPAGTASLSSSGSSGSLAIGGSIARGLVLAGTVQAATVQGAFNGGPFRNATITADGVAIGASHQAMASFGELGLLVDWYPNPSAGWHAGLSGGLGAVVIVNNADDSSLVGLSPAGSVFGGYDWAIGRSWSLGLSLSVSGAGAATMKHASGENDGSNAGYQLTPVSVGVQASILYF